MHTNGMYPPKLSVLGMPLATPVLNVRSGGLNLWWPPQSEIVEACFATPCRMGRSQPPRVLSETKNFCPGLLTPVACSPLKKEIRADSGGPEGRPYGRPSVRRGSQNFLQGLARGRPADFVVEVAACKNGRRFFWTGKILTRPWG